MGVGEEEIEISKALGDAYLDYSLSVILGRALPDSRDGLKPVHRRVLYGMSKLGLTHKSAFKKSARVVGDTIGKYHPHGDTAVYEAMVRLAQKFSMNVPLIEGQGNFGSIDGDKAAAMRYTEVRFARVAEDMLADIEKDTVKMDDNYDGTETEPSVLPARFPNLLINGSTGIAVGMTTNIPPNNISEICEIIKYRLLNPNCTYSEIRKLIMGPDFPTGGVIIGRKGVDDAYATGKGKIKLRARVHWETNNKKDVLVVTEMPYNINKSKVILSIATLTREGRLSGISAIKDESDREGIRVVITLKKGANKEIVFNHLLKETALEITYSIRLVAVSRGEPKKFTLLGLVDEFINHRKTVVIKRVIFDLKKLKEKYHILTGLLKALEAIKQVVDIVISTKGGYQEALTLIMLKIKLTELQAKAVLDMKLAKLTGMEKKKLQDEVKGVQNNINSLEKLLKSPEEIINVIVKETIEINVKFGEFRRTEVEKDYTSLSDLDLIEDEPMVLTTTHNGYIKRVPVSVYERQHRGGTGKLATTVHSDDFIEGFYVVSTHDILLVLTSLGRLHWLKVHEVPEGSTKSKGKAIVNLLPGLSPGERVNTIIPTSKDLSSDQHLMFFTKNGLVKRTNLADFKNVRSGGVKAIVLNKNDSLIRVQLTGQGTKNVFLVTKNGLAIHFDVESIRPLGRVAIGVKGIRLEEGDEVCDAMLTTGMHGEILIITEKGLCKKTVTSAYRLQNRSGKGLKAINLNTKTGKVVSVLSTDPSKDLMCLTSAGKMIRLSPGSITTTSRRTQGVKIVKLNPKETVTEAALCAIEQNS